MFSKKIKASKNIIVVVIALLLSLISTLSVQAQNSDSIYLSKALLDTRMGSYFVNLLVSDSNDNTLELVINTDTFYEFFFSQKMNIYEYAKEVGRVTRRNKPVILSDSNFYKVKNTLNGSILSKCHRSISDKKFDKLVKKYFSSNRGNLRVGTGGVNSKIHLPFLKACIERGYLVSVDDESGWYILEHFSN